jgi:hypothetical protein
MRSGPRGRLKPWCTVRVERKSESGVLVEKAMEGVEVMIIKRHDM